MFHIAKQYLREQHQLYRAPSRTSSISVYQQTSEILASQEIDEDDRAALREMQTKLLNGAYSAKSLRRKSLSESKQKEDAPKDYAKDWKKMAEVFDRLFFWTFLIAIVICTSVLFHPLTTHLLPKK